MFAPMSPPSPRPSARVETRHEVWARVVSDVAKLAAHAGLELHPLFRGLPFDETTVRHTRRVTWDDYCTLVERVAEAVGGLEALERLSEEEYHRTSPELTAI